MAVCRLPFQAEGGPSTWTCHGNWDEPNGGHGVNQDSPTDEQAYAYDMDHATGGKILSARAGRVIDLQSNWADDTHPPQTPGPGNYVWIRHADGTLGAYCHLKHNSVRVAVKQWVPQGWWIAECGNTGSSSGPHLHFDVHTHVELKSGQQTVLGAQLLVHFEDKTRTSFRPTQGEALSAKSNNVEGDYRQDHWRHCIKCKALYFAGVSASACPSGGEHAFGGGGNYTLAVDGTSPKGQKGWRFCAKCSALFFAGSENSRCPKGPELAHDASGSGDYAILNNVAAPAGHQGGWRWCKNCAVMWFDTPGSKCPATGGAHSLEGSGDYALHLTPDDWQRGWRLCGTCGGLFFGTNLAGSKCVGGGPHVVAHPKQNYFLMLDSPDAPGQAGWRWCQKCQGLWMGKNTGSKCPASGAHTLDGSGDYTVIHNADSNGPGEKGWRWCGKCQALWFAGLNVTKCPAGGKHSQSGSGAYRVQFDGHA